jgi:hypothetical protein
MIVIPLTLKRANEVVASWHRHNKPVRGCRFCMGAEEAGKLVAVVIVGRPIAANVDQQTTAEVTRLCVTPDAPKNACSFLYGAARRAWFTMGGKRLITYTLGTESGASLRGAGWTAQAVKVKHKPGKGWQSRDREHQPVFDELKLRWDTLADGPIMRNADQPAYDHGRP